MTGWITVALQAQGKEESVDFEKNILNFNKCLVELPSGHETWDCFHLNHTVKHNI